MCSKLTIKTPDRIHWCSGFINFNFEHIFLSFFSVSIVEFELVIVCWAITFFVLKYVMLWNDSQFSEITWSSKNIASKNLTNFDGNSQRKHFDLCARWYRTKHFRKTSSGNYMEHLSWKGISKFTSSSLLLQILRLW